MNSVVDDSCNKELPVAMNEHKNCLTDPSELPPQIPTDRVKDAVSHHGGNGAVICFVANETGFGHAAKVAWLLSDAKL